MRILNVDEFVSIVGRSLDELRNDLSTGFYHGAKTVLAQVEKMAVEIEDETEQTEPQNMAEDIVESFGFKAESYRQAKAKTEPSTDCGWK